MGDKATTTKAPDNSRRLAALESSVSALAVALAANGFKLEEGADPIAAAIGAVRGQAAKIDELEANASDAAIAAVARADKAEAALDEATKEIEQLHIDVNDLEERLEAKARELGDGAAVEEISPVERPEGARDFGPSFGRLEAPELAALIENGDDFELAFSNGKYELVELAPVTIAAKDLIGRAGRFQVAPAIHVRGADEQTDLIDGVALVQGGEQLDYCQFPRPLTIEPKQERRFERALTFG